MYALQCTQCDPRNDVPQVRVQEPAPEKQGAKSVIKFFFSQYRFSFLLHLQKN
jgi:hypothetical protein